MLLADQLQQFGEGDDAEERAEALLYWFNCSNLSAGDLGRLFLIGIHGFEFWRCPACHDFVCEGAEAVYRTGLSWGNFQGVLENDRTSYPGDGADDRRCDHCRCHNV